MLDLKEIAKIPYRRYVRESDRDQFKTYGFDLNELNLLKDMEHNELLCLMLVCGIRVYNGIPLEVMRDDEIRMAYLVWRADQVNMKKAEIDEKVGRRLKWLNKINDVVKTLDN